VGDSDGRIRTFALIQPPKEMDKVGVDTPAQLGEGGGYARRK